MRSRICHRNVRQLDDRAPHRGMAFQDREEQRPVAAADVDARSAGSDAICTTETVGLPPMPASRSRGKKPKVEDRRYLRPDEAHRLIDAAGKRGRYPFRDRVLVRLVYRHGLRASEAVKMRWSQVDLDAGVLHVARVKGSIDSTHSLDRDELRDLRKLRQQVTGLYVFETERGGPLSVDALRNTSCGRPAGWPSWT